MSNVILRVKRDDGTWAEIPALVGPAGPEGISISDIVLTSTVAGVSTYTIIMSDGSEKTFQVTDGAVITDVSLISTDVLIDTYRMTCSNGSYYEFKLKNGRGIKSISKTSTDVLSDTYTISYNDNTTSTFKVNNGRGITKFEKTGSNVLTDNYQVTYNDNTNTKFSITNGRSITKIVKTKTDVLTDTYTISYNDNTTSTYTIKNGRGIDYIEKDETIGLSDRYTIHYTDGTTSYYHVVNGEAGPAGSIGNRIYLSGMVDKVNDETGYERVKELKHSSFDKSKFTVVGSPNITSDGIASGFSTRDYLEIPINLTNSSLFSIDVEVDTRVGTGSGWVYSNPDIATNLCIWTDSNAKNFSFHFGQVNLKSVNVDYNSKYSLHFSRESETSFKIKIIDVISKEIKYDNTITAQIKNTFNVNKLNIGYPPSAPLIAIDLKSFSITVDGEEVFNGNNSYLDVIKSDNYTITGSPTITEDGIYQQNATSDKITGTTLSKTYTQQVKVGGRYTVKLDTKTEQLMDLVNFTATDATSSVLLFDGIVKSSDDWYVQVSNGTAVSKTKVEIPLKDGDIFDTELIIDKTNITLYAKLNESVTYTATVASLGLGTVNDYELSSSQRSWSGKVDLNTIHVYIDGDLAYQPCLKIPYTKAKTGAKIVPGNCQLRVEDCYNQYGAGNYYILDEINEKFALPMPDIYGLIQTLEDTKVNRAGDTMTGRLTLNCNAPHIDIYRQNPAGDTPETSQFGQIRYLGSDNVFAGAVENKNYTGSKTVDDVTTTFPINGSQMVSRTYSDDTNYTQGWLGVYTDSLGNTWTYAPHPSNKLDNTNRIATTNWVRNHCCTTAATTTSTASYDAPCYVVENYVNGTSWYRRYSDKYLEQGNQHGNFTGTRTRSYIVSANFVKSFSNTNYVIFVEYGNANGNRCMASGLITKKTTSFSHAAYGINDSDAASWANWLASGY